jgi:hypothetical protein
MEMARRRHRVADSPRVSGFVPTASPTRPPTSHVFVSKDDRLYSESFTQDEYAGAFVAAALEGEGENKWLKNNVGRLEIRCESGLRVWASTTEELEQIIEATEELELPEHMVRQLAAFKAGHGMRLRNRDGEEVEPVVKEKKTRAPKGERAEKAPKKEKPAGYKGVPELAAELNREGGEIRVVLRKHVTKPDIGWLWSNDDFLKVKAVVKKELG